MAMALIALFDFVSGAIKNLRGLEKGGLSAPTVWRAIRSQLSTAGGIRRLHAVGVHPWVNLFSPDAPAVR